MIHDLRHVIVLKQRIVERALELGVDNSVALTCSDLVGDTCHVRRADHPQKGREDSAPHERQG